MNNNGPSRNFDGSQDLEKAHRRKIQNRIAQRKHRERIKAQQRSPSCEVHMENTIPGNSIHTIHQNESAFCIPDYMLQDLNVTGSANEAQENPHRQQSLSLVSAFSSDQESEQNQTLEDQFTMFVPATRNEINGQFLSSQEDFLQASRGCRTLVRGSDTSQQYGTTPTKQVLTLLQNQRARICDQAEQYLEKLTSLYDIGVSLDILEANPNLRNLLMDASKAFSAHRLVKSHGTESVDSEET